MVSFIFDPSLVLYLPLYELDGASFGSRDAYGHLCTVAGALWRPDGRCFDGTDDYIEIAHNTSQLLANGGSIEAWIKPDSVGETYGKIVDKSTNANGGADGFSFFCHTPNKVAFVINDSVWRGSADGSVVFGDGNFYHVVATWDNTGDVTTYVNGSQSGAPGASGNPSGITTTNALRIGNRSVATDRAFDGRIAEVRLYSRALTSQETQRNYLATKWRYR
jgi:hypothetical protein